MLFRFSERLFVMVLLLGSMQVAVGLADPYIGEGSPDAFTAGSHLSAILLDGTVYGCGTLLILMRWRRVLMASRAAWPLLALTSLAPISAAWSVSPLMTLRNSALLVASTTVAIYLGERYTIEKLARLLAQTFCIMMVAIVTLSIIAPPYVIDYVTHIGSWKGLSLHKNDFGGYMAIAVIVLLQVRFRHFRWLRYVFLPLACILLWLSRSAGALSCCILAVAAMPLWRWARLNRQQRLLVFSAFVIVISAIALLMMSHTALLFKLLDRDATLTGRTALWGAVWPAILKQPILGYGYGAFWAELKGEALQARIAVKWLATAADNGYLDLLLCLGFAGMVAFAFTFLHLFRRAVEYIRSERGPMGLWPITYLCFFLAHNVVESSLLARTTLPWLLFCVLGTSLAVHRRHTVAQQVDSAQYSPSKRSLALSY